MMEYDPQTVFDTLESLDVRAYLGLIIGSICYYVQYLANVRAGFREKTHSTPVAANMWNFADDVTYLAMFPVWFGGGPLSHWFTQVLWFGYLPWVAFELITHFQTLRYSLPDIFKGLKKAQAVVIYVQAQVAIIILFLFIKASINDPIWLYMITTTQFSSIAFCLPMLLGRGSAKGLPVSSAVALVIAPASFLMLFLPAVAPAFDAWPTYLVGIACVTVSLGYLVILLKFRRGDLIDKVAELDKMHIGDAQSQVKT